MKHVRYLSKGNSVGLEDDIEDYWEIDAAGYLERSVHVLPDGTMLKYDQQRAADEHGALPEGVVSAEYLADASYGQTTFISSEEFEAQWSHTAQNEEWRPANKTLHPTAGNAPVWIRASIPAVDELDVVPEKDMRSRIKRIVIWLLIAGLAWCVILATIVWRYGTHDRAAKSDCIIVLGAAVQGTTASPVFEERIRHGISLYDSGYAPKLLFTGGIGDGQIHSEASVGRSAAIQHGIPATNILVEEKSRTTQQNLSEALAVMRQHGIKSAIIVSDPLHMKRSMMMAADLNIAAVSSPTPTSRYRSLKTKLGFLLREVYFIHHYSATGH